MGGRIYAEPENESVGSKGRQTAGNMMQAVILAGGLGTRLRTVSQSKPKAMVEVGGQPFLGHLLRMLMRRGLQEFLFLLGYKSEAIVDFLERQGERPRVCRWSVEPTPLGTGGALRFAASRLDESFIVINGDTYLDMDYGDLVMKFRQSGLDALMTVYDNSIDTRVVKNVAVAEGLVTLYDKNAGVGRVTHVDAGAVVMQKRVLDYIASGRVCSLEKEVYPFLIAGRRLGAYFSRDRFYDIGTPEQFREFEKVVKNDNI